MAKFAVFFCYATTSWATFIAKPSDRRAAIRTMLENLEGTLDELYFMLSEWDGMAILDLPDVEGAVALSAAMKSSGAFERLETHELIAPDRLPDALAKSRALVSEYRPPGV
ncbi:MAG TPA: GYD domain-containing protein [Amycolatopsis sp.]|jgi:uncharacterized protein with GYD domain|nr:GYD domain-containing protein [Amycolatopsis sp.]